ncbi:MAG: M15 family metallopeptidase [Pseudomonadota bacterium]
MTLIQTAHAETNLPDGFVFLDEFVPGIVLDIRYFSNDNFVGKPIVGYDSPRAVSTTQAALALIQVQEDLAQFDLGLKVFDAYRPQRAVDEFVQWAEDLEDVQTKAAYYPDVQKSQLIPEGYIAARSSHSRGSTVDLTLISTRDGENTPLDMGSPFDYFGPESWPDYPDLSAEQRANRMLLQSVMKRHGFASYAQEWWHFTLQAEPFPQRYFDFPIP